MIGSNRSGGSRQITDKGKRDILSLPYATTRVSRRVKPDQVSSYSLRVHRRPEEVAPDYESLDDRDLEPGEAEIKLVDYHYHNFLIDSVRNRPLILFKSLNSRRNNPVMQQMLVALISHLVKENNVEVLRTIKDQGLQSLTSNLGRSTWRYIVRDPDLRQLFKTDDDNYIGEMALNANTIYRQGTDVLRLLIPHIDKVFNKVEFVNIGDQQLFNTKKPNLMPSRVYPTNSYGFDEIIVGGDLSKNTWVHSPIRTKDITKKIREKFELNDVEGLQVHVHPLGFLPKYHSKPLVFKDGMLRNNNIAIPYSSINKVLSGFMLTGVTKPVHMVINPIIGDHHLNKSESEIRSKVFKSTSKSSTDILSQIKESGSSGYGESELDIYNRKQYRWDKGYRKLTENSAFTDTLFPHPMIKYLAADYRDIETEESIIGEVCSQMVSSLPINRK